MTSTDQGSRQAQSRKETDAVSAALPLWDTQAVPPRRGVGSRTSPEKLEARLEKKKLMFTDTTSPVERAKISQNIIDIQARLDGHVIDSVTHTEVDDTALIEGFIASAAGFAQRHGITYEAFRALGVPADVLEEAGLEPAYAEEPPAPKKTTYKRR
jgi:hypothetical protein